MGIEPAELLSKYKCLRKMVAEIIVIIPFGAVRISADHLDVACINGRESGHIVTHGPHPGQEAVEGFDIRLRVGLGKIEFIIGLAGVDLLHHQAVSVGPIAASAGKM